MDWFLFMCGLVLLLGSTMMLGHTISRRWPDRRTAEPASEYAHLAPLYRLKLTELGVCPDCLEDEVMWDEGPFSSCACKQGEDYGKRPLQRLQLMERGMAKPFDLAWAQMGYLYGPEELENVKLGWGLKESCVRGPL